MGSPELSVVCKNCGEEVSPYVTECPYCGTRLRKRAPKLERVGDEVRVREDRRSRRRRKVAERRAARSVSIDLSTRPTATILVVLASAIVLIVDRAAPGVDMLFRGGIIGPVGDDWWRYFVAPFVYDNVGYLFACGLAIAIFMPALERRLGSIPTALLAIGCGALGMLAADGLDSLFSDGIPVAVGGNGIALGLLAAWFVIRNAERRADPTEEYDAIAVGVAAAVLLCIPLVDDWASVWAGLGGAAVGAACGAVATFGGRLPSDR
jgi:membrane associated rhomboid family serine protease